MDNDQFLIQIENVFFEAMLYGWASKNPEKISIPEFPGMKGIVYESGQFRVVDGYFVTPYSDMSTGMTMIWHATVPVWVMYYGGWYDEEVIPFLKSCLNNAYEEHRFYGGRGPFLVRDQNLAYENSVDSNSFEDFVGEENIYDTEGQRHHRGFHWYKGMSLLKNI
ncbi:DUF5680 domain-containing protein [Patescibacteria group bacterium]